MPFVYPILPLSYGYPSIFTPFDLPTSNVRTTVSPSLPSPSPSSSSSSPGPSSSSSSSSSSFASSTPSSSSTSKRRYDPIHFEVDARRRRLEEETSASSRSSTSSEEGDWKACERPSGIMILTEKELARKERRRAVNRSSARAFRMRKKAALDEQIRILAERDAEAKTLRAEVHKLEQETWSSLLSFIRTGSLDR
ncbi:hypothetical protein BDY24DRAFT_398550 [Mrakia frigida]|uniref:uncharacterized protein n=1 Tax=Mrakia frigida TaxID=29902 RepID=UPI003FCC110B